MIEKGADLVMVSPFFDNLYAGRAVAQENRFLLV